MYTFINNINYAIEAYNIQKDEVKRQEYILNILYKNMVSTVRQLAGYDFWECLNFKSAQNWLSMIQDNKLDKRKKYPEKEDFEVLQRSISSRLFGHNSVEILEIISGGFEGYYWNVRTRCKNIVFSIDFPVLSALTTENFEYANQGKLTVGIENNCIVNIIEKSYQEKDIANAIISYMDSNNITKKEE